MREHTTGRARVKFLATRITEYQECLEDAVAASRAAGATWEQIGDVLGITAQAAHSRYAAKCEQVVAGGGPASPVLRW